MFSLSLQTHAWQQDECRSSEFGLLRLILGLRIRVVTIEKECNDLFKNFFADVDCAMHPVAGLNPIDFADYHFPRHRLSAIAKLDMQQITAQNHGHSMIGVVMPGRGFSRREPLPPHKVISAMMQHVLVSDGRHRKTEGYSEKARGSKVEHRLSN